MCARRWLELPAGWCSGPAGRRCPGGGGRGWPEPPPRGPAARRRGKMAPLQCSREEAPAARAPPPPPLPALLPSFLPRGGASAGSLPLCVAGAEGPPCPPVRGCARTAVPAGWASSKLGPQRRSWQGFPSHARSQRRRCGWGESPPSLLCSLLTILRPEDFGFCPLPVSILPSPGDVEDWGG